MATPKTMLDEFAGNAPATSLEEHLARRKDRELRLVTAVLRLNRVRVARLLNRWTQRDLEDRSGVTLSVICRAENDHDITLTNAMKIAHALGYAVEELWELENCA